jgi:hypothetical protein
MASFGASAFTATQPEPKAAVAKPVDAYAERDVPKQCSEGPRPGLLAFKYMIMGQVGGSDLGVHNCRPIEGKTTLSYHAVSRAWDWGMNAKRAADRERVDRVLNWLLRTDERGVPHANARRLGIGEIIWNREIVTLWNNNPAPACRTDATGMSCFRPYDGVNPHTDHVHFSFSVPGANDTMVWSSTRTISPSWYLTDAITPTADPSTATPSAPGSASAQVESTLGTIAPFEFGFGFAVTLSGDWDGDGRDSLGLYDPRDRRFYLRNALTAGPTDVATIPIGPFGAVPFVGDWNGDGVDEFGVYEPTARRFSFVDRYGQPMRPPVVFGEFDDLPLIGNWDGTDPDDEIGVYRPARGTVERQLDSGSVITVIGTAGDIPLGGYFDGDGSEDVGVFRPSDHTFYLRASTGTEAVAYGNRSSTPVVGDWDGDGLATPGVGMTPTGPVGR